MIKLNLGAGDTKLDGFISVDKYDKAADVQADLVELPYDDDSVDQIVAYQVIEHVPYWQERDLFAEMYRVLKPGRVAIVECPDMEYIAQQIALDGDIEDKWIHNIYGQYYRPWDKERYEDCLDHEGSKHRNAFTLNKLVRLCEPLGFRVTRRPVPDFYAEYPETLSVELRK